MPPKNDPANQPESQPPDLFSSVEARAMIEEFREAIRAGVLRVTPENEVLPVRQRRSETEARQPEAADSKDEDLAHLMEWFERRREQKAQETRRKDTKPSAAESASLSIRQKVIERVAHKVVESWDHADQEADPANSLREQIVERISDDILRRLQRNLE